jgi:type IX secretion system PorP/SprF family membrane protein
MKYFINTLKIVVFLLAGSIYSQQEANNALYRYTMNVINPAYAGADGSTNFTTNIRSQWQDVQDAPETQSFFFSRPFGEKVGLGVSVVNDEVGIERKTSVFIDFSYKLPIADDTNIFLGLKAGGNTYGLLTNNLRDLGLQNDPAIVNFDSGFKPNVGIGAYLHNEKYFLSLSVPSLLSSDRINEENGIVTTANDKAHIYLSGGYNFDIGGDTEFRPSVMMRYVNGAPVSLDATAAFRFFDKFEVGAIYRTDKAFGGVAMLNLADWMDLGYGYENSSRNEISNISQGTHEILVRFNFANGASESSADDN